jgi:hypothetical protein
VPVGEGVELVKGEVEKGSEGFDGDFLLEVKLVVRLSGGFVLFYFDTFYNKTTNLPALSSTPSRRACRAYRQHLCWQSCPVSSVGIRVGRGGSRC